MCLLIFQFSNLNVALLLNKHFGRSNMRPSCRCQNVRVTRLPSDLMDFTVLPAQLRKTVSCQLWSNVTFKGAMSRLNYFLKSLLSTFTYTQNVPVTLWLRSQTNFTREHKPNFFGGVGRGVIFAGRALKVGQIFSCSMSILSIHSNRRQETVSMPKHSLK